MKIYRAYFISCCIVLCAGSNNGSFAQNKAKTIVTGESMEMLDAGKKVIFSGNAQVVHGQDVLKADEIIQDKVADVINAKGNVSFLTIINENEPLRGLSYKAVYNLKSKSGELSGKRPKLFYATINSTSPVTLSADTINFNNEAKQADATGNVEIISSSASAFSHRALFFYTDKKMYLTGLAEQPEVMYYGQGKKDRFFADKITMFVDKKRMILEGNVKGFVHEINKK
ncbi:MAG: LptA/OstA family protein [Elusimicrobia bacterium]|nr:LptA/OstA family protein [Candidatus Liberimonas magnetica]